MPACRTMAASSLRRQWSKGRTTGRVWGDVTTAAFSTEEGAFLRGQVRMEEHVELQFETPEAEYDDLPPAETEDQPVE